MTTYHEAAEPNLRPEEPNPPRDMVEVLKLGRLVAERATWVDPVFVPTFRLLAVRNPPGVCAER